MSAIFAMLSSIAVPYILTKVSGRFAGWIRSKWWGRLLLWFKGRGTPADKELENRLESISKATPEQKAAIEEILKT